MADALDPVRALRIILGMVIEHANDEDSQDGIIYMIAHQASWPTCNKNHPTWTDFALEKERELVEAGLIEEWNPNAS